MKRNGKKAAEFDRPTTIISKDTVLEAATLKSESPVQLAGQFIGDLDIQSSLVIGETGKVKGNIKAQFILVAGEVVGNIQAEGSLHITSTGNVRGEIICESIIVDQDATLNSTSVMKYSESLQKNQDIERVEKIEEIEELEKANEIEEMKGFNTPQKDEESAAVKTEKDSVDYAKDEKKYEKINSPKDENDDHNDEGSDDTVFVKVF